MERQTLKIRFTTWISLKINLSTLYGDFPSRTQPAQKSPLNYWNKIKIRVEGCDLYHA